MDSSNQSIEFQLKLMKSSFKTPLELIKKNHKSIQRLIEKQNQTLLLNINKLIESQNDKLVSFSKIVANYERFHQDLKEMIEKHNDYVERLQCRLENFQKFVKIVNTSKNVQNEELKSWYKQQIDMMIANYLIRTGEFEVGFKLIQDLQIEKLIDYDIIKEGLNIYNEIKDKKNLSVLIEWCSQNKKSLTKLNNNNNLEFETYFQKFIELLKNQKIFESIELSKKYLIKNINKEEEINLNFTKPSLRDLIQVKDEISETQENEKDEDGNEYLDKLISASRLLLFDSLELSELFGVESSSSSQPSSFYTSFLNKFKKNSEGISPMDYYNPTSNEYNELNQNFISKCLALYSSQKWHKLANFFLYNFNLIYGINQNLEFLILLSTGISTLKTKSCNHDLIGNVSNKDEEITFDDFLTTHDHNDENLMMKRLNNCPICSIELKKISQNLPYSHQIVSNIFNNPVMLPNGNIYQLNKLLKLNENLNIILEPVVVPSKKRSHDDKRQNNVKLYNRHKKIFKKIYNDENKNDRRSSMSSSGSDSDSESSIEEEPIREDEEMNSESDSEEEITTSNNVIDFENFYEKENFNDDLIFEDLKFLGSFKIKDPLTTEIFNSDDLVKVFPT